MNADFSLPRPKQGLLLALTPTDVVMELVDRYAPKATSDTWVHVQEFVKDAVAATAILEGRDPSRLMRVASPYVVWCVDEHGLDLRRELIFAPSLIDRYCRTQFRSEGTAGTYRSVLLAIANALMPGASGPKLTAMHKRTIQTPYTAKEMASFQLWSRGQNTELLRHRSALILAFCAGAGMQAGELRTLMRHDVVVDDEGILVHVRGTNARLVPVLRSWEPWVAEVLSTFPTSNLLWGGARATGGKNMVNHFTDRASGVSPSSARLRATWITTHLSLGTPVKDLMRAGGMSRFENLDQYVAFIEPSPMTSHRALLRGGDAR
jgi:hypothetical protein